MTTIYKLVAIIDPDKKGGTLLIAEHEFNPEIHKLAKEVKTPDPIIEDKNIDISKMSIEQMTEFAAQYGINLEGADSKKKITAIIEKWKADNKVE